MKQKNELDEALFKFESAVDKFEEQAQQHKPTKASEHKKPNAKQQRIIDTIYGLAIDLGYEQQSVWIYLKGRYITFDIDLGDNE